MANFKHVHLIALLINKNDTLLLFFIFLIFFIQKLTNSSLLIKIYEIQ